MNCPVPVNIRPKWKMLFFLAIQNFPEFFLQEIYKRSYVEYVRNIHRSRVESDSGNFLSFTKYFFFHCHNIFFSLSQNVPGQNRSDVNYSEAPKTKCRISRKLWNPEGGPSSDFSTKLDCFSINKTGSDQFQDCCMNWTLIMVVKK